MTSSGSPDRVSQDVTASGQAQVNQAGRDQTINISTVWAAGAGPGPEAVAGLPASVDVVGRDTHVDELLDLLNPAGAGPTVAVVTGLAGIGKTALALHTAHQARARGWFDGGTLFVRLRGYDNAAPVTGAQALEMLLRALGIRDTDLPPTAAEQEILYRSELARRARELGPVLVVADDASTTAQLLPLLPAHPGSRLLATSRDTLTSPGLPARLIRLSQLDHEPSTDLIAGTLTRTWPEDSRPSRESEALEAVAAACGGLPLALSIVAAQLVVDPGLPVTDLATGLADARTRLEALHYQDRDGRSLDVQAAFELSYQRLDKQPSRMFRLLSLNPGPDIATIAAGALTNQPVHAARKDLADLARAGLVSEQPIGSGRWRMHDLTRLYADDLGQQHAHDHRQQALGRLMEHYRTLTDAADDHLRALPGQPVPDRFPDTAAALAWLDAERHNLTSAVPIAAAGHPRTAVSLALCLAVYLQQRRLFHDAIATANNALTIARKLGNRQSESTALNNLGNALLQMRRFDEAIDSYTQAAAILRKAGDRHSEGGALSNLGNALRQMRRFDEAIDSATRAAAIFREAGDRHGEGQALNNLGTALQATGRIDEAIDSYTQAAAIFRETGDRHGEGQALNNLGNALRQMRRFDEAIDSATRAAAIFRETGDRHGEGQALNNLGIALHMTERIDEAIDSYTQAAVIHSETGDRHGEGETLSNLGIALQEMRRFDEAIDSYTQAAVIFRETGDLHSEGQALNNLGTAQSEMRGPQGLRALWRKLTRRE